MPSTPTRLDSTLTSVEGSGIKVQGIRSFMLHLGAGCKAFYIHLEAKGFMQVFMFRPNTEL